MKNPNLTPSRVLAVVLAAALVIFVIARRRDDGALSRGEWLSDTVGPDDLGRLKRRMPSAETRPRAHARVIYYFIESSRVRASSNPDTSSAMTSATGRISFIRPTI